MPTVRFLKIASIPSPERNNDLIAGMNLTLSSEHLSKLNRARLATFKRLYMPATAKPSRIQKTSSPSAIGRYLLRPMMN